MYELEENALTTETTPGVGTAPDTAEHFVVAHKEVRDGGEGVVYEVGDELPEGFAREVYAAFGDRIAVFDAAGFRVDPEESTPEADGEALTQWRHERGLKGAARRHECPECERVFATEAALHGHTGSHPDADADGDANPDADADVDADTAATSTEEGA